MSLNAAPRAAQEPAHGWATVIHADLECQLDPGRAGNLVDVARLHVDLWPDGRVQLRVPNAPCITLQPSAAAALGALLGSTAAMRPVARD